MLVGDKVILEEIGYENIEQLRQWRNDPGLRKFFREFKDISKDKQEQWYSERGNNSNQEHVYFQIMAIKKSLAAINPEDVDLSSRYLIGCCGLHYIDWRIGSAEFGIFLGTGKGSGRGKEALLILSDYGFKELNLHKIWCEVWDNNPALDFYRHVGFKDEGILRDNYFHEGKFGNSYILSMLNTEWASKYGEKPMWKINAPQE